MEFINEGEYSKEKTLGEQKLFEFHWVERNQELYELSTI